MCLIPRSRALTYRFELPPGPLGDVVLALHAFGVVPGHNIELRARTANGEVWSLAPSESRLRLRTATIRDAAISVARATPMGAFAEGHLRARRGESESIAYELPARLLGNERHVSISVRRLGLHPVWLHSITLEAARPPVEHVANVQRLEAYVARSSIAAGDALEICAPLGKFSLDVVRFGTPETSLAHEDSRGSIQAVPPMAFRDGAQWSPTIAQSSTKDWKSGLYGARVRDESGAPFTAPFIVRPAPHARARVLVVASTNTWQAYNEWGGASLYYWRRDEPLRRTYSSVVNLSRPNPMADPDRGEQHLARSLRLLVEWLEERGYEYDMCSDLDLDERPDELAAYPIVILDSHAEYWTSRMLDALETHVLKRARSLLSFSGNGLYWKTVRSGDRLEVRKPSGVHPDTGELGGLWGDLGRPTAATISGVTYTPAGAKTEAPYRVIAADHWAFAGTGLKAGETFGEHGVFGGASGHETDKMNRVTPSGTVHLARGTNARGGGADMVHVTHPNGGQVFSVGSITFVGTLSSDTRVGRIVTNVLDRFLEDAG